VPEARAAETRAALIAGVFCYAIWGLIPILYLLSSSLGIGPFEMTAHRALWAVLWAGGLVLLARQAPQVARVFRDRRTLGVLAITSLLIGGNWLIFVWAISNWPERWRRGSPTTSTRSQRGGGRRAVPRAIDRWSATAVGLAAVGVAVQGVAIGQFPWISLSLALLFWVYGILRKRVAADAQTGLFFECLFLALPGFSGCCGWRPRARAASATGSAWSSCFSPTVRPRWFRLPFSPGRLGACRCRRSGSSSSSARR
jgi:chloramphenicol-sensitive protein RarD